MTATVRDNRTSRAILPRPAGWGLAACLLLLPAVAMRFTPEVAWTASDFVFAGVLLIGGGALIELAVWKVRGVAARAAFCLAILAVIGLIWAEGAVGLFH